MTLPHLPSRNVIAELHIDRGYIGSTLVQDVLGRSSRSHLQVMGRRNGKLFAKSDFQV